MRYFVFVGSRLGRLASWMASTKKGPGLYAMSIPTLFVCVNLPSRSCLVFRPSTGSHWRQRGRTAKNNGKKTKPGLQWVLGPLDLAHYKVYLRSPFYAGCTRVSARQGMNALLGAGHPFLCPVLWFLVLSLFLPFALAFSSSTALKG